MKHLRYSLLSLFALFILSSCATAFNQPVKVQEARLGEISPSHKELISLPKPKDKISASVYKFRDQTGQYKNLEVGSSFSTVVTQGATSILLKAMEDSGWFKAVERENQSNLLTERQLIRSSQQQYLAENPNAKINVLPPLTYANLLLEGGIVSYDHNIITGGFGLRYFGVGGSTQYREDRVTVYLRAVSTRTGEILKTVYVSKTLLSQALDGNIFRYVRFQRILEAETGFAYNEPAQMVVTDAIEKALHSLIVEGIEDGLWIAESQGEEIQELISSYQDERKLADETKLLNRYLNDQNRGSFAMSVAPAVNQLDGDFANSNFEIGGNFNMDIFINNFFSIEPGFTYNQLSIDNGFSTIFSQVDLSGKYIALPFEELSPYFKAGGSILFPSNKVDQPNDYYFGAKYDLGVEYLISENIGFFADGGQTLFFSDELDGIAQGRRDDNVWDINAGVTFYIQRKQKVESKEIPVAPDAQIEDSQSP